LRERGHFNHALIEPLGNAFGGGGLKTEPQRHAEFSLRLTGRAGRFLSLLLIELVLPRLIHQVRERAEIHSAALHRALRAGTAHEVRGALSIGADEAGATAGREVLHIGAEAKAVSGSSAAVGRVGIAVLLPLAHCHAGARACAARPGRIADLRGAEHALRRGAARLGEAHACQRYAADQDNGW